MDLSFILFVFINIVLILGITYKYYAAGDEFGSLIVLAGFIGAAVFFGIRWFTGKGEEKDGAGAWPPAINTCPDFLTLHTVGTAKVCIDTVGVARGGANPLMKWTGTARADGKDVFSLSTTEMSLCDRCAEKGVTWEGVYNGSSCLGGTPPSA
jgi:hypothetical protein